jgi:hypothetical protein
VFVLWGSGGGKYNRPCVCVRFCACVCCMLRYTRALNGVTLLPRWKRNLALAHLPRTSMELSHRGGGLSWARMYQRKTCGSSVKHAGLKKIRLGQKRHPWFLFGRIIGVFYGLVWIRMRHAVIEYESPCLGRGGRP